jgi:serine/threonine protein kinase
MQESTFKPGDSCGGFHVLSLIGCGGAAEVYKVIHPNTQAIAALKCLRLCHGSNTYIKEHMLAEAELLLGLQHDNVVHVEDVGIHEGVLWMAMEYLSGMTLRALLKKSRALSIPTALYYAREIADGVAAIHEMRVVHRDLKPENIMITEQNRVKVLDMGAAKFFDLDIKRTLTGTVLGTPLYMSPEHIREEPIDARADVYSLGLILYEMLAGQHPFVSASGEPLGKYEVCNMQLRVDPPPLTSILESFPASVSDFVQISIAKNRNVRPGTMSAFAKGVRGLLKRVVEEAQALPSLPEISLVAGPPSAKARAGAGADDRQLEAKPAAEAPAGVEKPAVSESASELDGDEEPTIVFQRVAPLSGEQPAAAPPAAALGPQLSSEGPSDIEIGPNGTEVMDVSGFRRAAGPQGSRGYDRRSPEAPLFQLCVRPPAPNALNDEGPSDEAPPPSWGGGWMSPEPISPVIALRRVRLLEESLRVLLAAAMIAAALSLGYSRFITMEAAHAMQPETPLPEAQALPEFTVLVEDEQTQEKVVAPREVEPPARRAAPRRGSPSKAASPAPSAPSCGGGRQCAELGPIKPNNLPGPRSYPGSATAPPSPKRSHYSPKSP